MTYDVRNCLTAAGSTLTAGYTADGIRAWKQGSGASTYFLYDGELLLGEYDSAGTMTAVNTWGANGLVSRRSGGSSVHYTWDAQGSLAQRLDGAGAVLTSHLYDAFGAESASGSTTDPYRYGGQWGSYTDGEAGLCLLTHRYYDPGTGRFLNRDPIGYGGDSPTGTCDPSGLVWRSVRRRGGKYCFERKTGAGVPARRFFHVDGASLATGKFAGQPDGNGFPGDGYHSLIRRRGVGSVARSPIQRRRPHDLLHFHAQEPALNRRMENFRAGCGFLRRKCEQGSLHRITGTG